MTVDRAALLDSFRRTFGRPAQLVAEAPGRVNLIGEHTDYNEGHVLPLAIDRTLAVAAAMRRGDVHACALDCGEEDRFPPDGVAPAPGGGWRNYVRGVVWALGEAGHRLRGLDLAFTGDVPAGAGLSSSAALEVALAAAFAAASDLSLDRRELALLAQRPRSRWPWRPPSPPRATSRSAAASWPCWRSGRRTVSWACSAGSWTS